MIQNKMPLVKGRAIELQSHELGLGTTVRGCEKGATREVNCLYHLSVSVPRNMTLNAFGSSSKS
jgi:hypothetical protein